MISLAYHRLRTEEISKPDYFLSEKVNKYTQDHYSSQMNTNKTIEISITLSQRTLVDGSGLLEVGQCDVFAHFKLCAQFYHTLMGSLIINHL